MLRSQMLKRSVTCAAGLLSSSAVATTGAWHQPLPPTEARCDPLAGSAQTPGSAASVLFCRLVLLTAHFIGFPLGLAF